MKAGLVPELLTRSHPPLLYGWERSGLFVQDQLPSATLNFSVHAKKGANHTINKLDLSQDWRGQSELTVIHAVPADRALLPSKR